MINEKNMNKDNNSFFILLIGVLCGIFLTAGIYAITPEEQVEIVEPIDQAELVMVFDGWGDTPEGVTLFDFAIINYGFVEAKDVMVECRIYDSKDNVIYKLEKNLGNIASTSLNLKTISERTGLKPVDESNSGSCRIMLSENYEAMDNRLPNFNEYWD